jgi:hypothetical protein
MKIILFTASIFFTSIVYSQQYLKTTEYKNDKKRRDLFYTNEMVLVKEIYYNLYQQITNEITYDSLENVIRFKSFDNSNLELDVDFKKGEYNYPKRNLKLKFKDDYVFNGIQQGDKIIVNYVNGKKNGALIQTDSAITGRKMIQNQGLDTRYLKFNLLKYYNDTYLDDNYQLFKGVKLNFKDNLLHGKQNSFYFNGKIKFLSNYNNGLIAKHESFDDNGNILSKIISDSFNVINKPIIKNGILFKFKENSYLINPLLSETGNIIKENLIDEDWSSKFRSNDPFFKLIERSNLKVVNYISQIKDINNGVIEIKNSKELKKIFDDNKFIAEDPNILRIIFSIPLFEIKRIDFNKEEEFVELNKFKNEDNSIIENYNKVLESFDKSYNKVYNRILFLMDPKDYELDNSGKASYSVRNLSKMYDGYDENIKNKKNKEYLQSIIRKSIYNVIQYQNHLNNYIDPYETDLFGFRYKHNKMRIYYSYDEAKMEGYRCSGDCSFDKADENLSIEILNNENNSTKYSIQIFRESKIVFIDYLNRRKYIQYFDIDGVTIRLNEIEL